PLGAAREERAQRLQRSARRGRRPQQLPPPAQAVRGRPWAAPAAAGEAQGRADERLDSPEVRRPGHSDPGGVPDGPKRASPARAGEAFTFSSLPGLAVCAALMPGHGRRALRAGLWAATIALVCVVGVALWRNSTPCPARALRPGILPRVGARFPRPPHVPPPEAGTFGERAGAPWDALAALEVGSADVELCRAVREGEQRFDALTPSCRRELKAGAAP